MLDNSNNGSANFGNAQGAAVWQSEWIEAPWGQLTTGSYNGIGNVVVDSDISQTEEQILADLDTVNRMLLGSNEAIDLISDIKRFATRHTFNPGVDPVTGSSITAPTQSLAQVFQSVHEQGLPDLTASAGELTLNEVALPGDGGRLSITLANQGSLQTKHPVTLKVFATQQATLDSSAVEIGRCVILIWSAPSWMRVWSMAATRLVPLRCG